MKKSVIIYLVLVLTITILIAADPLEIGHEDFCDKESCYHGYYDCDSDSECVGEGLVCKGIWGFSKDGCCYPEENWNAEESICERTITKEEADFLNEKILPKLRELKELEKCSANQIPNDIDEDYEEGDVITSVGSLIDSFEIKSCKKTTKCWHGHLYYHDVDGNRETLPHTICEYSCVDGQNKCNSITNEAVKVKWYYDTCETESKEYKQILDKKIDKDEWEEVWNGNTGSTRYRPFDRRVILKYSGSPKKWTLQVLRGLTAGLDSKLVEVQPYIDADGVPTLTKRVPMYRNNEIKCYITIKTGVNAW